MKPPILILLLHLVTSANSNLVYYLGCWEYVDLSGADGVRITSGNLYDYCSGIASSNGYELFALSLKDGGQCYTSFAAPVALSSVGYSDGCSDGKGGVYTMDVYQIVTDPITVENTTRLELRCHDDMAIEIISAECDVDSLDDASDDAWNEFQRDCPGNDYCSVNVDKVCMEASTLRLNYACLYAKASVIGGEEETTSFHFLSNLNKIIPVIVLIVLIHLAYRHRRKLQEMPILQGPCWSLHTSCPCLKLYPPGTEGPHVAPYPPPANQAGYPPPPTNQAGYPPPPTNQSSYPPPPSDGYTPYNPQAPPYGSNVPPPYSNYNNAEGLPPPPSYAQIQDM